MVRANSYRAFYLVLSVPAGFVAADIDVEESSVSTIRPVFTKTARGNFIVVGVLKIVDHLEDHFEILLGNVTIPIDIGNDDVGGLSPLVAAESRRSKATIVGRSAERAHDFETIDFDASNDQTIDDRFEAAR